MTETTEAERESWREQATMFLGWPVQMPGSTLLRLVNDTDAGIVLLKEAREALVEAEVGLTGCYDVNQWPADGTSDADKALRAVRATVHRLFDYAAAQPSRTWIANSDLAEALEDICEGDPVACFCERVGGDMQTVVIPKYAGNCIACRLRAALGVKID